MANQKILIFLAIVLASADFNADGQDDLVISTTEEIMISEPVK